MAIYIENFPFLADKVEKSADAKNVYGKYDIYMMSRISKFPFTVCDKYPIYPKFPNQLTLLSSFNQLSSILNCLMPDHSSPL